MRKCLFRKYVNNKYIVTYAFGKIFEKLVNILKHTHTYRARVTRFAVGLASSGMNKLQPRKIRREISRIVSARLQIVIPLSRE